VTAAEGAVAAAARHGVECSGHGGGGRRYSYDSGARPHRRHCGYRGPQRGGDTPRGGAAADGAAENGGGQPLSGLLLMSAVDGSPTAAAILAGAWC